MVTSAEWQPVSVPEDHAPEEPAVLMPGARRVVLKLGGLHPRRPSPVPPSEANRKQPWAQCDNCNKWRRLPYGETVDKGRWYCAQHPNPQINCDTPPDELVSDEEDGATIDNSNENDGEEEREPGNPARLDLATSTLDQFSSMPAAQTQQVLAPSVPSPLLARKQRHQEVQQQFAQHYAQQPQYLQPQYTQPQYPQPQYAQPLYAQPQYPQPQYPPSQYAQPQYVQPQYAQPLYVQPLYTQHCTQQS